MVRTVLIIPPNDPEAVMILEIARAIGLQMIRSAQPHGATIDTEPDIVPLIRAGEWQRIVIVEMPGPKTEAKIRKLGAELILIDHHRYPGMDRAQHPKTGRLLPSSLEQFLKLFRVNDAKLTTLGFDPYLVRGIAMMDRGFVWELFRQGYPLRDVKKVLAYQRELMATVRDQGGEDRKERLAQAAWKKRKAWRGFQVVVDGHDMGLRGRISLIIALTLKKPTPLILVEKRRGFMYVQESDFALALFKKFGGFTFGGDRNWGYHNSPGVRYVTLKDIQNALESWAES